jgi:opacity protein-like surface antigen
MIRKLTLATALAAVIALPAIAEDPKAPAIATPAAATNVAPAQKAAALPLLTSLEAQAWIGKPVYSSDGQKVGDVLYIQRDDDNKITWMNANVGGFLGVDKHQIKLKPEQINLQTGRVVLDLTATQVKEHPKTM